MKRLPLGIQTYQQLAEENYLYVDKTADVHQMLTTAGKVVFLSRPRRFGKSLLCSTLASVFEGRRDLFTGLAIDALEWSWIEHPVIRIDFNAENYKNGVSALRTAIKTSLDSVSKKYKVKLSGESSAAKLSGLIEDLHAKYGQKSVVIIDEYDKPLLNTIDEPDIHLKLRDELKGFFGVLKSADAHLRFAFITGVTRFSKVSIFSDLNQLDDVSLDPRYAAICGITQDELERDFADGIKKFTAVNGLDVQGYTDKLRALYNGYRFTEADVKVYNPFGLINHFMKNGKFSPWWFESGTPTFLYKLMRERDFTITDLEGAEVQLREFTNFDIEGMQLLPLLYQSGYLTIKDYDDLDEAFTLGFPNEEVSSAFSSQLLIFLFPENGSTFCLKLPSLLNKGKPDDAMRLLQEFLAAIPYDAHEDTERYYHSMFDLIFRIFGMKTRSEVRIAAGRIDTLVETRNNVYCFEFKYNGAGHEAKRHTAAEALAQIDSKDYLTPWRGSGKQLYKIGAVFSAEKRNVSEWEISPV
ncbi:MAG: ATP-binding protein [Coriobacteriales bacterium]|jgi:hypothetical protein|nr:ATP-binding protein [Coriobacteriales bacterium]